jgi:hypothetical protein
MNTSRGKLMETSYMLFATNAGNHRRAEIRLALVSLANGDYTASTTKDDNRMRNKFFRYGGLAIVGLVFGATFAGLVAIASIPFLSSPEYLMSWSYVGFQIFWWLAIWARDSRVSTGYDEATAG